MNGRPELVTDEEELKDSKDSDLLGESPVAKAL
jgi:hypothetical protein